MNDSRYAHYNLLGLALKSEFKSKSAFNAVFKRMTGKTPPEYKRCLDKFMTDSK